MGRGLFAITDKQDNYLDIVDRAGRDREPFWSGATVFPESRKARLVDRSRLEPLAVPAAMASSGLLAEAFGRAESYEIVRSFFDTIDKAAPGTDVLNRMIYSEFKLLLPELLLMRVDKIGMSVSIEPGVPFLDHLLVEFTMNLPMDLKVEDGVAKSIFKEAVRFDYEYRRNGTANLFMLFGPLDGWRRVVVTDRHTAVDYAHVLKDLADIHFTGASTIVLVQDNLNIHSRASLYEAFPAAEARRLVERFEWHYTPLHGSWLNLAESELGVLSSQCLDRRIPDKETLTHEISAWQTDRNAHNNRADWHFTTQDARIKLNHLYPSI